MKTHRHVVALWASILLTIAPLISTIAAAEEYDPSQAHYDKLRDDSDLGHIISVSTNSDKPIEIGLIWGTNKNDTLCKGAGTSTSFELSAGKPYRTSPGFSYKASPEIALYEYHICLEIDGKTYRGWRGFDPGFETHLEIDCFIDSKKLNALDRSTYLCKTKKMEWNRENHQEYAEYCWTDDVCRRFETEKEYQRFQKYGPQNVGFARRKPSKIVEKKKVRLTPISKTEWQNELNEFRNDLKKTCSDLQKGETTSQALKKLALESCLSKLEKDMPSDDGPRPRRPTEKEIQKKFPIVRSLAAVDRFRKVPNSMIVGDNLTTLTYSYEATVTSQNEITFYQVTCVYDSKGKFAECTLSKEHAFYADNPLQFFFVGDTSNVNVAVWAIRERRKTPVKRSRQSPLLSVEDQEQHFVRMKQYLDRNPRVVFVEEAAGIVSFSYRGQGCFYASEYKILGDLNALEYIDTNEVCI